MSLAVFVFRGLLLFVAAYALLRGGRDERLAGLICVVGAAITHYVISPLAGRFADIEVPVLMVDFAVLAGFVMIALRSDRFWPMWIAGLQLTTILGHLTRHVDSTLLPKAYGVALGFWAYPIVIILAIGTWRQSHRQRHRLRLPDLG